MNTKLRKTLADLCKDFGLTEKALDELAAAGAQGLSETSTDEDVQKAADSLVPFAKLMQAEITRKTRKQPTPKKPSQSEGDGEGEGDKTGDSIADIVAAHMEPFRKQLEKLQAENDTLKADRAKAERSAAIAAEAKRLGIPEYLTKRVAIGDGDDIKRYLEDFKQELVANALMPKDAASEAGTTDEAMKAEAKAWAESLPNK